MLRLSPNQGTLWLPNDDESNTIHCKRNSHELDLDNRQTHCNVNIPEEAREDTRPLPAKETQITC